MMKVLVPVFLVAAVSVGVAIRANNQIEDGKAAAEEEKNPKSYNSFRPEAPGPNAAVIKKRDDNHFWADAKVNGSRIEFMVDTGASTVALRKEDALSLGFRDKDLNFEYKVRTAGGETRGAFILLDEIQIGNVKVEKVEAMVIESDLHNSLLGMSFLSELGSYEVRKSSMIIRE
jgi:aspartyl protease family protein